MTAAARVPTSPFDPTAPAPRPGGDAPPASPGAPAPRAAGDGAPDGSRAQDEEPTLKELVDDIERLEALTGELESAQQLQVLALKNAVERLHREALRRLIRGLKGEPGALGALRQVVTADELVLGVLHYHELIKHPTPPVEARVAEALDAVRPSLESHGGDVELVAVEPPEVRVRLLGSCVGCPASSVTLVEGVEQAIKERCPEIERVVSVSASAVTRGRGGDAAAAAGPEPGGLISPFALVRDAGWSDAGAVAGLEVGRMRTVELDEVGSVLLARVGDAVKAYVNACAHLGMPLDGGALEDGGRTLVCPYHGFRYSLDGGECLTAPEVALSPVEVRVRDGRVFVRGARP